MIKFTGAMQNGGTLYGFGLSEGNLNRLEFNDEPIFFDFGYTGHPELFGLIFYMGEFGEPSDIAANPEEVGKRCIPFFDEAHGVTVESLRVFPIAKSIMQTLRSIPMWSFQAHIEITNSNDMQLFFSGRTEQELEQFFREKGLISSKTKRTYKGFERRP